MCHRQSVWVLSPYPVSPQSPVVLIDRLCTGQRSLDMGMSCPALFRVWLLTFGASHVCKIHQSYCTWLWTSHYQCPVLPHCIRIALFRHPAMTGHLDYFQFLAISNKTTVAISNKTWGRVFWWMCACVSLGRVLRSRHDGSQVGVYAVSVATPKHFPKWLYQFTFPKKVMRGPRLSTFCRLWYHKKINTWSLSLVPGTQLLKPLDSLG